MATVYQVQVPLDGSQTQWFTIATCDRPEHAAEMVRVLLANVAQGGEYIRIKVESDPTQ